MKFLNRIDRGAYTYFVLKSSENILYDLGSHRMQILIRQRFGALHAC